MKNPTIWAIALCFSLGITQMNAQEKTTTKSKTKKVKATLEEDEGPLMFKFEPSYTSAEGKRKQEILHNKAMVDSLDISDRKRKKLMKAVYSSDFSKHLSKIVTVDTKFEDAEN